MTSRESPPKFIDAVSGTLTSALLEDAREEGLEELTRRLNDERIVRGSPGEDMPGLIDVIRAAADTLKDAEELPETYDAGGSDRVLSGLSGTLFASEVDGLCQTLHGEIGRHRTIEVMQTVFQLEGVADLISKLTSTQIILTPGTMRDMKRIVELKAVEVAECELEMLEAPEPEKRPRWVRRTEKPRH